MTKNEEHAQIQGFESQVQSHLLDTTSRHNLCRTLRYPYDKSFDDKGLMKKILKERKQIPLVVNWTIGARESSAMLAFIPIRDIVKTMQL